MQDAYDVRYKLERASHPSLWKHFEEAKLMPLVGGALQRALGQRLPKVNDVIEIGGRGAKKRFVIVKVRGSVYVATALSGAEKGSLIVYDSVGGVRPDYVNVPVVFTTKTASKLYTLYEQHMARSGNGALTRPYVFAEDKPEETFDVPDSDASPDVTVTHRPAEGTIAHFERNREIYDIVRKYGFVWAPQAKVVRRVQSVGNPQIDHRILQGLKHSLNARGFKVAFDVHEATERADVVAAHQAKREHMLGRAEMIRERGVRAGERSVRAAQIAGQSATEALSKLQIPGYYPTPPALVAEVMERADIDEGDAVLEPSAGTAALADAATAAGGDVDVIEIDPRLQTYLKAKGHALVATDIMRFVPGSIYDVVLMNPPFEDGQDALHVRHAYELLRPGGRLVAIMSEGPFFRGARKDAEFRTWLEALPHETEKRNATFGRATVNVRIVTIDKPDDAPSLPNNTAVIEGIVYSRSQAGMGNAEDIATELVEKAGTSRRAARRLETAKRVAKEEAGKAAHYAARAEGISRAVSRVGVERVAPPSGKDLWKKGDRVWSTFYRIAGTIDRVDKLTAKVRAADGRLYRDSAARLIPLEDAVNAGFAPKEELEAPVGSKSVVEQLAAMIKGGAKRDMGASAHSKDPNGNGFTIAWGPTRDTFQGKMGTERNVYYRFAGGGPDMRGDKGRRILMWFGQHVKNYVEQPPDVKIVLNDADGNVVTPADQAYAQIVHAIGGKQ
jgi:predicted RNA methylase